MALEKQLKMVQLLLLHSKGGDLDWKPTANKDTMSVTFEKASVLLKQTPSREVPDEYDYMIRVVNDDGVVIESFSDVDLGEGEAYRWMNEMFNLARRKALGVDSALDSIISELEDIIPF